ncbi:peptidylprolyl isomerase, partial [Candidatus Margulisiibacteriota bacterium]
MRNFKRLLLLIFCWLIPLSLGAEDFAAKVNGEIITLPAFDKAFQAAKQQLAQQEAIDFSSDEGRLLLAATKRSILEEMIDFVLLNQGAKQLGVEVSEKEIEQRVKKVQHGFPSKAVFSEALSEDGISLTDLEQGIKQEILIEKIIDKLAERVKITDGDIENFFKRNKELFSQPKRVQVFQVLLPTKEEADEISKRLQSGEDFRKLAKRYSLDQMTSADGGELGFIEENQLPPHLAEIVAGMKTGDISEPIAAEEGFYIISCGEILQEKEANLEVSKKQVRDFLVREKKRSIYERWFEQYKNKAQIEINQDLFPKVQHKAAPVIPKDNEQEINNTEK